MWAPTQKLLAIKSACWRHHHQPAQHLKGAQISSGRAAPGAIERIRIDKYIRAAFPGDGVDQWSDEDGFDAAIAKTVTGICGSGIIEVLGEMYLAGVITSDGVIDGAKAAKSNRIESNDRTFASFKQSV